MGSSKHRRSSMRRLSRSLPSAAFRNVAFGLTGIALLAATLVGHAIMTTPTGAPDASSAVTERTPSTASDLRATATQPASATPTPSVSTSARPVPPDGPKLLFGIGTEADAARDAALVKQAPVKMLTSWYNGPNDLSWMTGWRTGTVRTSYAAGYAMHLVVFTNDPEATLSTARGSACGRGYPLSSRFVGDMTRLAETFAGPASGPPAVRHAVHRVSDVRLHRQRLESGPGDHQLLPGAQGPVPCRAPDIPPARAERQGLARVGRLAGQLRRPRQGRPGAPCSRTSTTSCGRLTSRASRRWGATATSTTSGTWCPPWARTGR